MKISPELMLAVLAMDSYNEGYAPGLKIPSLGETTNKVIGDATIISDSSTKLDPEITKAAGFYAVAYKWDGKTIISFRGTDNVTGEDPANNGGSDLWNKEKGRPRGRPFHCHDRSPMGPRGAAHAGRDSTQAGIRIPVTDDCGVGQ